MAVLLRHVTSPKLSARNELLSWQAKPISPREHVDLDTVAHELLGELAHVPRETPFDDRRLLPAEDQDARRAHGAKGH
jgi:hypothetical protein